MIKGFKNNIICIISSPLTSATTTRVGGAATDGSKAMLGGELVPSFSWPGSPSFVLSWISGTTPSSLFGESIRKEKSDHYKKF